jgi:hypothetical protein
MKKNNNMEGEKTQYCKVVCNNHIVAKNNVNSQFFSNTSRRTINADRIASFAPRFVSGLTIFGNIGEGPIRYIPPQVYTQDIKNGIIPDEKLKQHYVIQSLRLNLLRQ